MFSEVYIHLPRDFEGSNLRLQSFLIVPIKEENQASKREYRHYFYFSIVLNYHYIYLEYRIFTAWRKDHAELTFDNDSDFASFLTSSDSSSSEVFNDVWFSLDKSIVTSQWYIKECSNLS